jgi:acetylornithine deacetylase/succinyl-diaminopimelate desuccinylase-like protein
MENKDGNIIDENQSEQYRDIKNAVKKDDFIKALQKRSPFHHSLTRDTCSITRLGGSSKINVVPALAWAEIDCRILPDQPAEEFISKIKKIMEPYGINVKTLMAFTPAASSTETELYNDIKETLLELYPESHIIPRVTTGFTDSHFTRDIGINSYGFNPIIIPLSEFRRIHGNDERININAFKQGIEDQFKILERFLYN